MELLGFRLMHFFSSTRDHQLFSEVVVPVGLMKHVEVLHFWIFTNTYCYSSFDLCQSCGYVLNGILPFSRGIYLKGSLV